MREARSHRPHASDGEYREARSGAQVAAAAAGEHEPGEADEREVAEDHFPARPEAAPEAEARREEQRDLEEAGEVVRRDVSARRPEARLDSCLGDERIEICILRKLKDPDHHLRDGQTHETADHREPRTAAADKKRGDKIHEQRAEQRVKIKLREPCGRRQGDANEEVDRDDDGCEQAGAVHACRGLPERKNREHSREAEEQVSRQRVNEPRAVAAAKEKLHQRDGREKQRDVEGLHLGPCGWFLRIRDLCGERGRYARSFIRGMLAVADSTPHRPTLGMRK